MGDFRDAARALRSTPLVTAVAVLSLALGIGATTAMFSIVDSLILRRLPVAHASRLALLGFADSDGRMSWTNPIWEQVRDRAGIFGGAFAWSGARFNLAPTGQVDLVNGILASGDFFDGLGVRPLLGRTFGRADDVRGGGPGGPVAVISYGYWQRRFGGSADAVGRSLTLDRVAFTIVGVTPADFFGPEVGRTFDVIVPLGTEPLLRQAESWLDRRSTWWLSVMVRLRPDQPIGAATAALRAIQPQIRDATIPDSYNQDDAAKYLTEPMDLTPAIAGVSSLRDRYQRPLLTIGVVVALVLLIACGNIANLLLARATARKHELSVRQALGASRFRLARQLLAESALLSAVGAALGVVVALWGGRLLVSQLSTQTGTVHLDIGLDWRLLLFVTAVSVATALLFGTAPALQAARSAPIDALKEHGRDGSSERGNRLGGSMVIAQVALSLVLVVTAGLFVRTFASLATLELGFEANRVLVASIGAQRSDVAPGRRAELYQRVREAALAVPGVAAATVAAVTPVSGTTWNTRAWVAAGTEVPVEKRMSFINYLTPGWFATMGTPIVAGRDFHPGDDRSAPDVAIVNQAFVDRFIGEANPLGRIVLQPEGPSSVERGIEIVGVAADAVYRSLREPVPPTMYLPLAQSSDPPSSVSLSVRAATDDPAGLTRAVTAAVAGVDGNLTVAFRTLDSYLDAALVQERLVAMLSAFFGGLALLLAGLGLYGVTSYAVTRRRNEIGIRMALGAPPGGVMRLVLGRVGRQVGLGVAIGVGLSWWAGRFVETLLYGLAPHDPPTTAAAAVVLVSLGALAGWLPARRAAAIDPAEVLRDG